MEELTKVEDITMSNAPKIYKDGGLDVFIKIAKEDATEAPDLSTVKGRKRIASLSAKVSSSKAAVEKVGREYLKKIKAKPREIEKELKKFVDEMNDLRDETRKPLTEWEEDQARIKAEEEAKAEAERLAAQVEADHEIAILLNEKFDREKEEAEERARIEREEQIKRETAAKAEAEKAAAEEAARQAKEAELAAKQAAIEAEERRKREAEEAEMRRIEQEKQAKIAAEQAAEQARLNEIARQESEAKRQAEELAAREANKKHIGAIRKAAKEGLILAGLTEEQAKAVVLAIHARKIPNVKINY